MILLSDPNFLRVSGPGALNMLFTFHNFLHIGVFYMFLSSGQYLENLESAMVQVLLETHDDEPVSHTSIFKTTIISYNFTS